MKLQSIYKYMPHYEGKFFEHFCLRATQRAELNDPFEFLPTKDFYESIINYSGAEKEFEWAQNITYEEFCSSFFPFDGVISFTETRSNLLMWAHYSQRHTGIVIEFDITKDYFRFINRVRYNNIKPTQITNLNELFFLKSDEWIYEKEYRIVKQLREHDFYIIKSDINLSMHPAKKTATHNPDQCEEMYMFCVPKDSIKSVTFGCNMNKSVKNGILSKIADDKELSHVEIWQAKLSEEYFHLEFERILKS